MKTLDEQVERIQELINFEHIFEGIDYEFDKDRRREARRSEKIAYHEIYRHNYRTRKNNRANGNKIQGTT